MLYLGLFHRDNDPRLAASDVGGPIDTAEGRRATRDRLRIRFPPSPPSYVRLPLLSRQVTLQVRSVRRGEPASISVVRICGERSCRFDDCFAFCAYKSSRFQFASDRCWFLVPPPNALVQLTATPYLTVPSKLLPNTGCALKHLSCWVCFELNRPYHIVEIRQLRIVGRRARGASVTTFVAVTGADAETLA